MSRDGCDMAVAMTEYRAVGIRGDRRLFEAGAGWGTVHSIFPRVQNLHFLDGSGRLRLITLLPEAATGLPDSVTVPEAARQKLQCCSAGTPVLWRDGRIQFPGASLVLNCPAVDGRFPDTLQRNAFPKARALKGAVEAHIDGCCGGFSLEGWPVAARLLEQFADDLPAAPVTAWERILPGGIGAGAGLTPSFDDAVMGILAVYHGLLGRSWYGWDTVSPAALDRMLEGRTTDVSRKYLVCGWEGRFSDTMLRLMGPPNRRIRQRVKAVSAMGATSGLDTLIGVHIGCGTLLRREG